MSSSKSLQTFTVTNTEFYKLVVQARDGIYIDCENRWYEIACPSCTRSFRTHEIAQIFRCPFCDYEDYLFNWRPDRIYKDGPALRPIGWKLSYIVEN